MSEPNYYKILGVSRNATEAQIKSAYRKLAKRYHPDRNRGDTSAEARFKEVQQAYKILSNPEKRKIYDQFGRTDVGEGFGGGWRPGPGGARVSGWPPGAGRGATIEDLEDLFSVFGGAGGMGGGGASGMGGFEEFLGKMGGQGHRRRRPSRPTKAQDIEHVVQLPFLQAVTGTTLDLKIAGAGLSGGRTISVKVPPGVSDGQKIRLRGKGQPGSGSVQGGDLYIVCKILPHAYFKREGNDILLEVPLTIVEATLGAKVEIPTLDGKTMLTIPPGTPSGAKLRLREKGIQPAGDKPPGDQYVMVRIVPPKSLTPEQQELMRQLGESLDPSPRSDLGW